MDEFYTPSAIADSLLKHVPKRRYARIADFAAGDGALLVAASKRFPQSEIIANDKSRTAARRLREHNPDWIVGCADFLSRKRSTPRWLSNDTVDLAVLNPPFSCRGASRTKVVIGSESIWCSLAIAFMLQTASHLRPNGVIAFILPSGALTSEKDIHARSWFAWHGKIDVVTHHSRGSFAGCFPRVVAGVFRLGSPRLILSEPRCAAELCVELVRGTVQMPSVRMRSKGTMLVHSTNLQNGGIDHTSLRRVANTGRTIFGPSILIPRVGTPNSSKVCLYSDTKILTLSDCVIGIRCENLEVAHRVRDAINQSWNSFQHLYTGTCARFISMARLRAFLATAGFVSNKTLHIPKEQSNGFGPELPIAV